MRITATQWQLAVSGALLAFTLSASRSVLSQSQTTPAKNIVGTITAFEPASNDLQIKPDNAPPLSVKLSEKTVTVKVAPGEKDLSKAETIRVTDLSKGDRVLITLDAQGSEARRIIVMSSADIAKRNEADRLDWTKRGVSGIVAAKSGNQITLKMRTMQGPTEAVVTVDDHTAFRRYAPDSVKFSDARPSVLADVGVGDQLRARGQKSDDGLKVTAQEVVFGTFLTKAGSVASINLESKEITVKELGSGKTLLVKLTSDSQLKKMPDFGGNAPGSRPGAVGGTPPDRAATAGGPPRGPWGGPRDISQMVDRMPAIGLEELKPGQTIVWTSTKGAQSDQLTAIILLANADMLIRMASMQGGSDREAHGAGRGMAAGMTGQMDGLGEIELPGMVP